MQPGSAQVVILGAGRSVRGGVPSAMVDIDERGRVMDWLLDAFAVLGDPEIYFVGGFKAEDVVERYPQLRVVFNRAWAETGPVESLGLVPLDPLRPTYVCYSDVVFRRRAVELLAAAPPGAAVAVDSQWRLRYDGRSPADLARAEKVRRIGSAIVEMGVDVGVGAADAEFAGLARLSPSAVVAATRAIVNGSLPATAALPALLDQIRAVGIDVHGVDLRGEWAELDAQQDLARFVLGTKAESLDRLRRMDHGAVIGALVSFTRSEWSADPAAVLDRIAIGLPRETLIVRSSALSEDGWRNSGAGQHESIADVAPEPDALASAIDAVFASYLDGNEADQVLVQEMVRDVALSGVVMTRTHALGAPYYVVNFDDATARTDVVTSGGDARTVVCLRGADHPANLPASIAPVLSAVQKIEAIVGHDSLDIEFAVTGDDEVHVLQVRPIAMTERALPMDDDVVVAAVRAGTRFVTDRHRPQPTLVGRTTRYSVMADWNPAEIVGTTPRALALSLYRYLVTDDVWARQRAEYGYRDVRPCPLLVEIAGHPYVDVRACFNSFVPATVSDDLATRLVEHQVDHLARHPQLHDKVEFAVLITCLAPDFDHHAQRLLEAGFTAADVDELRDALRALTIGAVARLDDDLDELERLQARIANQRADDLAPLDAAAHWLELVRTEGTPLFSHLARAAFVATSILRGLGAVGAITPARIDEFLATTETVFGRLQADAARVRDGVMPWTDFVDEYGHLRPGTYDITSLRYRSAAEEYLRPLVDQPTAAAVGVTAFAWTSAETAAIRAALAAIDLPIELDALDRFIRGAITGREAGKFVFTRPLSDALEALAAFGATVGLDRDDVANLRIGDVLRLRDAIPDPAGFLRVRVAEGVEAHHVTQGVALPAQIATADDLVCFEQSDAEPNFVTALSVQASVTAGLVAGHVDVAGRIVLIPSADPGYDWLLARGIAGLITMFGGANSHMAVRAAECRLPAAIGVGESRYAALARADVIRLDCGARTVSVVR
ncbi:MAG: PEP-utilizing enzyme [Acidimicrobiia bacterium]